MQTRQDFNRIGATEESLRLLRVIFGQGLPYELTQVGRRIQPGMGPVVTGSSSSPAERGFSDPAMSARQHYVRTDETYNGAPVWRGRTDPNWWIVRGIAPVDIVTIDGVTIANPTVGGPTAYTNVWKMIERKGPEFFDTPPTSRDYYKSTVEGVVIPDGTVLFGVIDGGPHPSGGVYLRQDVSNPILHTQLTTSGGVLRLETWQGEEVTHGKIKRPELCGDICATCTGFLVEHSDDVISSILEWFESAEARCAEEGLVYVEAIMKPSLSDDLDTDLFYRGHTCCKEP